MRNGIGRKKKAISDLDNDDEYLFQGAGFSTARKRNPQLLAVPMVSEYSSQSKYNPGRILGLSFRQVYRI
jgi:hypothetical protein